MIKAVITVLGRDRTGIIARVSGLLYEKGINIADISQTIMSDIFTMIMLVELSDDVDFSALREDLKKLGGEIGVEILIQREDIFNSMHRI